MAEQAGMGFGISFDEDSIDIYFRGYSDKIENFIYSCLERLIAFDPSKSKGIFKQKKEAWLKDMKNLTYDDPSEQLEDLLLKVLITNNFINSHQISV